MLFTNTYDLVYSDEGIIDVAIELFSTTLFFTTSFNTTNNLFILKFNTSLVTFELARDN